MIDTAAAHLIWGVLVVRAGASPDDREPFVHSITTHDWHFPLEYRFMGLFGFGGKFRVDSTGRWYVDYYPEDGNHQREEARDRTNEALATIQKEMHHGTTQDGAEQGR